MITDLPRQEMPDWLAAAGEPLGNLPLLSMLSGSVYYPACRFDGKPVKHLAGNYHSFVYVDYGVTENDFLKRLHRASKRANGANDAITWGFWYRLLAYRDVVPSELTPRGWTPIYPTPSDGDPRSHRFCSGNRLGVGPYSNAPTDMARSTDRSDSACFTSAGMESLHSKHCTTGTMLRRPWWPSSNRDMASTARYSLSRCCTTPLVSRSTCCMGGTAHSCAAMLADVL